MMEQRHKIGKKVDEKYVKADNVNGAEEMMWYFLRLMAYLWTASFSIFFILLVELPATAVYGVLHDLTLEIFGKWNWFFKIIAAFMTFAVYIIYMVFVGKI